MTNVSVTAVGTTISINSKTTKTYAPTGSVADNTKTLVRFHRWRSSWPQYIYLDLHGATSVSPTGRMVVYGVPGVDPSVDPNVFDAIFAVENGQMLMQTNLDLNEHRLGHPKLGSDLDLGGKAVVFDGATPLFGRKNDTAGLFGFVWTKP